MQLSAIQDIKSKKSSRSALVRPHFPQNDPKGYFAQQMNKHGIFVGFDEQCGSLHYLSVDLALSGNGNGSALMQAAKVFYRCLHILRAI